jgi:diguanylate cyclase (GGDEF)-like protein
MTVDPDGLLTAVPHVVVDRGVIAHIGPEVANELGCDPAPLLRRIESIGTRLDDATFEQLLRGESVLRVRLGPELLDRPVRLRRLGAHGDRVWLEVRSLAAEMRLESLLRRSGYGHMLLTPEIELLYSISSNELSEVFPGDNPLHWVDLMDPDDMQTLGRAIFTVGADPTARRTVRHRLNADRTYTIVDTVESVAHDPDLRGVLVRSRLDVPEGERAAGAVVPGPFAGLTVSDHMPIGVVVASTAGTVLHRNSVAVGLVGARDGQLIAPGDGEPWLLDGLDPDQQQAFLLAFEQACTGRTSSCTIRSPLRADRWLRLSASLAWGSTVVITIEDITELSEAELALRASNRLLQALDSHSEELVVVFDGDGHARYTSSSIRRHLRSARIEQFDDIVEYVHAPDHSLLVELERRVRADPGTSHSVDLRVDVDDTPGGRWHHAAMTDLLDDPDVAGVVLALRDVHERHLMERELRFWATHDALTTLPDRAALRAELDAVLQEATALGRCTALIFCDVDRFKDINDQLGHHVGDLVLTEMAARLRASLRGSDVVGRFGGDEFVVVVPNVDDAAHALALAERIFATVTGPTELGDHHVTISVSMGVAVTDDECVTADDLLHCADLAMYEAKRSGRGRLALHRPDRSDLGGSAAAGGAA